MRPSRLMRRAPAPLRPCTSRGMVYIAGSFFFQAEDGIRDVAVTGVQTCALPILPALLPAHGARTVRAAGRRGGEAMSVGIEGLRVYVPQYALRLTELAAARDVPPEDRKSVV